MKSFKKFFIFNERSYLISPITDSNDYQIQTFMNSHGNVISSDCPETLKLNFVQSRNNLSNPSQQKIAKRELQDITHGVYVKIT
jgi:hypothetical protein